MSEYKGQDRRSFLRLGFNAPLACKVCKKETIDKLLKGYTSDISESGLFCCVSEKVSENDILWLSFDRTTLNICAELEKKAMIYQNGIVGKVVRVEAKQDGNYDLGIQFLTRVEEAERIYPTLYLKPGAEEAEDGES
jgi:hypothetical protein